MFARFFAEPPPNDPAVKVGRAIGTVRGVLLYVVLTSVALRGLF